MYSIRLLLYSLPLYVLVVQKHVYVPVLEHFGASVTDIGGFHAFSIQPEGEIYMLDSQEDSQTTPSPTHFLPTAVLQNYVLRPLLFVPVLLPPLCLFPIELVCPW